MIRCAAFAALLLSLPVEAARFSFVAYGDTTYRPPRDDARTAALIRAINAERPAFAIHLGDFKGYTSCSDDAYRAQLARFATHDHPVVMTPGDNDWADCRVESAGGFDPLERLSTLRRIFFATDRSIGGAPMPVVRQSAANPENMRWIRDEVVFATVHAIGPHNNLVVSDRRLAIDAIDRSVAGEAWIRETFRQARNSRAPALVISFQVDPFLAGAPVYEDGPLDWIRRSIREEAATFDGQILIVHGDSHRLTIDHPFRRADIDNGTTTGMNVTRLQVPGWPDHRAVRVDVDTSRPEIFGFRLVVAAEERAGAPR